MPRASARFRRAIALVTALVMAAAPGLGYAHLATTAHAEAAEICSAAGLAARPTDSGDAPPAQYGHCQLCLAPNGALGPARAAQSSLSLGAGESPAVPADLAPARAEPVRAARPRGPPPGDPAS
jgi:hypothetical protein